MADKIRVDELYIEVRAIKNGDADDPLTLARESFYPGDDSHCKSTMRALQESLANFEVRPSLKYVASKALDDDPSGPEGVRHTMNQIQDWYHRRWIFPYARECAICAQVPALHGPSTDHQFDEKKEG